MRYTLLVLALVAPLAATAPSRTDALEARDDLAPRTTTFFDYEGNSREVGDDEDVVDVGDKDKRNVDPQGTSERLSARDELAKRVVCWRCCICTRPPLIYRCVCGICCRY